MDFRILHYGKVTNRGAYRDK